MNIGAIAGNNAMKNQITAANAALLTVIDWDKIDPQAVIEAANQGRLSGPLTKWLAEKKWQEYLRLLSVGKDLRVKATKGQRTIKGAAKLFPGGIYPYDGFGDLADEAVPTSETKVEVSELVADGKYADFLSEDRVFGHEEQVLVFCEDHYDWLRKEGYATFIPFRKGGKVFVAAVRVDSDKLDVDVDSFGNVYVWDAEYLHRVVFPQLAA